MRRNVFFLILIFSLQSQFLFAQLPAIERIEPLNWWVGFKDTSLQLLIHGDKVADKKVSLNYAGVKLISTQKVDNPNYLFVNLQISAATKPGKFNLVLT
ncbi:cyclomaltodextrinase N-terminal domain-containing protein [Pedobacter sp. UC225_65]|uniref:cyclomaltodextrinase N-terminal domain-containing protein n=1 Tax=Pedobacter sp. UC225_65 TaxID=3350173 RepID=UPI00366F9C58